MEKSVQMKSLSHFLSRSFVAGVLLAAAQIAHAQSAVQAPVQGVAQAPVQSAAQTVTPAPVSDAKAIPVVQGDRIEPGVAPAPSTPVPAPSSAPTDNAPAVLIDNSAPITATATIAAPRGPADLWGRIRTGFRMPDLFDAHVQSQEQWYSTRPQYIGRMTERSRKYLYHIVEELERRQMPTELALLPFIESAFNPQAVSSAKAAGMWQFIPSTGRDFNLKQNAFHDNRRDVQKSTRAALDYLQKLHNMFGDWHLALAAYNWGEGSVQRAQRKNQAAGLGTGYLDLNMPNETRQYVPKLQAVKNIVADPQRFNAQLPEIPNHPYFQAVKLSRDMDVNLAARLADVKVDDFRALNPSANKPMLIASGTPEILLPWDNADIFLRNLQAHRGQMASWTAWRVPSTMKTAQAAKQFGMSEEQLRSMNNIPPRMLIKAGSTLMVPRSSSNERYDVSAAVADNAHVALAPEIVLRKTSVRAGKGDTVASIAKRYRVSPAQVAQWNKVSASASFKPKQAVVLYLPAKAKAAVKGKGGKASAKAGVRAKAGKAPARSVKAAKPVKKRR
jgi:membrane-bound lytic murein transglycosylase D